jgi:hypothetical protein
VVFRFAYFGRFFAFDCGPIGLSCLLGLVWAVFVENGSAQVLGQIVLVYPVAGIIMRIFVALILMGWTHIGRDVSSLSLPNGGSGLFVGDMS